MSYVMPPVGGHPLKRCSLVVLLVAVILLQAQGCEDLHKSYCLSLSPAYCQKSLYRHLCCASCKQLYRPEKAENEVTQCPHGNKHPACVTMDPSLCYSDYRRLQCCEACQRHLTNMQDCSYGDRDPVTCKNIAPNMCYDKSIKSRCCQTCEELSSGDKQCPYGDRRVLIRRKGKLYNCISYIAHFGSGRCRIPGRNRFREGCCSTCVRYRYR